MPLALLADTGMAHTLLVRMGTDGKMLEPGKCIRRYWDRMGTYVVDVKSPDLRCRTSDMDGSKTESCPVAAGSMMSLAFNRNKDGKSFAILQSHIGPITVYIAPLKTNGDGDVWVKIYESGWDSGAKEWATDRLIREGGIFSFTIPPELENGDYLVRAEVIALQYAQTPDGTQFYPGCAHITVTGGGSTPLPKGVAIPGVYTETDPGILYKRPKNGDNSGYVIPGPPVYVSKGAGSNPSQNNTSSAQPPKKACRRRNRRRMAGRPVVEEL
ncbi:hypothetical protein H4R18_005964 [Coemansia javaensis]|uniref:AA9 family lytic polysaccharide monooxygenase n=1 Tax=Coemansia javaensis TaxID=2761396 RepID=A0A9W8H4V7_9FUNG|nr:hypothetical protein H4R18_005975 [Coemansia javaensis]KAJ2775639.1 hypothetical protein H4R18_005964 [Coemansia javaensis]